MTYRSYGHRGKKPHVTVNPLTAYAHPASQREINAATASQVGALISGGMGSNVTPNAGSGSEAAPPERWNPKSFGAAGIAVAPQVTMRPRPAPKVNQPQQPGLLDQLLQSMLSDSASQSFDYESAIKQTEQALRQSYGAEIGAIQGNNRAARKTTAKNRRIIEQMYNGLAQTYGRASKASVAEGNNQAKGMMDLANQTNQTITDNSNKVSQSEADMLKGLNLQATADQVIQPDFKTLKETNSKVSQQGQKDAATAKQLANVDARFFARGGVGAQFEGTNRSADLLTQLQDYIRQNRGQIATLRGQEAADMAKNRQSMMSAAASAQAKADAQNWQHMMDIAQLKANIENTNFDNRLAANKFQYQQKKDASKGSSATSYLPKNLTNAVHILGPAKAGKLLPILESLWGTDAFRTGKSTRNYKNGTSAQFNMTPFEAAAMAEQAGKQAGLSPAEINKLKLAAMASVG